MATIYAFKCRANGHGYIGCTKAKLAKRAREHRCLLNSGRHTATRLLADWRIYGPDAFEIVALEVLPDASLSLRRERELWWMASFKQSGLLYNEHEVSFAPVLEARVRGVEASRTATGNRWTPEANLKRRLAQLGKPKGHGAKISATKRAKAQQVMR
jgi:group I intron endonuclease